MSKSKMKDLRGMSDEQLGITLADTEKHLFQLRFQSATDRLETPSEIRKARREIARILTIRRERSLGQLTARPADQHKAELVKLEAAEPGPGKRAVKRQIQRLQALAGAAVLKGGR